MEAGRRGTSAARVYLYCQPADHHPVVPEVAHRFDQMLCCACDLQIMDILPDTDIPGMLDKVKEVTVSGITVSSCIQNSRAGSQFDCCSSAPH